MALRTPLQGGLPPAGTVRGAVVEIACDESGFSGTNLLDPATPIITHASVDLGRTEAVALIASLRSGFRFSPHELKSGQFLRRAQAGEALGWFLGQLRGRAYVHLVDKEFFLATRVVDLLIAPPTYAAGTRLTMSRRPAAVALYRSRHADPARWAEFLTAFAEMVRPKRRYPSGPAIERFLRARDALATALPAAAASSAAASPAAASSAAALSAGASPAAASPVGASPVAASPAEAPAPDVPASDVLAALDPTRVRAVLRRLDDEDRSIPPPLEPLLPALAETILQWSAHGRRVLVVHDEQSALTADRLTRLQRALAGDSGVSPLAGLVMVDSRDDARVQIADLLAGVARRSRGTLVEELLSPTSLRDPDAGR